MLYLNTLDSRLNGYRVYVSSHFYSIQFPLVKSSSFTKFFLVLSALKTNIIRNFLSTCCLKDLVRILDWSFKFICFNEICCKNKHNKYTLMKATDQHDTMQRRKTSTKKSQFSLLDPFVVVSKYLKSQSSLSSWFLTVFFYNCF